MFKRFDIFGTSPLDIKNLNENFKTLWLKVFGNLSIGDMENNSQNIINTAYRKAITNEQVLDDASKRITSIETNINTLEGSISTKVSKKEFDSLGNRVSTAESSITQLSNNITLKVDKNGIISAINLYEQGATINANKINLTGYVTMSSLQTSGATVINGDNITTGTINCNRIGTPAGSYPIIRLFPQSNESCSIDATYNNEVGYGDRIRLKWDRYNYISVGTDNLSVYLSGSQRLLINYSNMYFGGSTVLHSGNISSYAATFNGSILTLSNGCDIDCTGGIIRLRYNYGNYIAVNSTGMQLYVNGTNIFEVTNNGVYYKGTKIH